jgi:nicotinate-nucleotide pyrophosphorylase (carboxylating)
LSSELLTDPALAALVRLALDEDGVTMDVTTRCVVPGETCATAKLLAKERGIFAGAFLLEPKSPLRLSFPGVGAQILVSDGHHFAAGDTLAEFDGPAQSLLGLERTLLNFLQRLCGIATETARYVAQTEGTRTRIQETRKTCPGWRRLDKYAVAVGGGLNHRLGLHDQVLIKENHLQLGGPPGDEDPGATVANAIRRARAGAPAGMVVEIEVENLSQFRAALEAGVDVIMLDEFRDEDIRKAVTMRDTRGDRPLIEVSGGIRLDRIRALAMLGVDRISVGALTHSVRALDLSMKITGRRTGS